MLLRTCAAKVNGYSVARALLDTGSNKCFVKRDLARTCQAKVISRKGMTVTSFGGQKFESVFDVVMLSLQGVNTKAKLDVEAYVVDDPVGFFPRIPTVIVKEAVASGFEPVSDLCGCKSDSIGIILGEAVYDVIVKGPTCEFKKRSACHVDHFWVDVPWLC